MSIKSEGHDRLQGVLGYILRYGVIISSSILLIGAALFLFADGQTKAEYGQFNGKVASFDTIHGIFQDVATGDSLAIMQLGVLCLIATPFLQVFFCLLIFAYRRNVLYICLSAIVFTVLLFSFFGR